MFRPYQRLAYRVWCRSFAALSVLLVGCGSDSATTFGSVSKAGDSGTADAGASGHSGSGGSAGGSPGAGGSGDGGAPNAGGTSNTGGSSDGGASSGGSLNAGGFANTGGVDGGTTTDGSAGGSGGSPGSGGVGGATGNGGSGGTGGTLGTGGAAGTGASSSAGGAGGSPPDSGVPEGGGGGCDPLADPETAVCLVDEAFGVFVSPSGSDGGLGTRASPFKTLTHALTVAHGAGKRIYACAGSYSESLDIGASLDGSKVYGGLSCQTWDFTGAATIVTASAHGIGHRIHDVAQGVVIRGLSLRALDAAAPGDSSIALLVANATGEVHLVDVTLSAGKGSKGAKGQNGQKGDVPLAAGETLPKDGEDGVCAAGDTGAGGSRICFGQGSTSGGSGAPVSLDSAQCGSEIPPYSMDVLGVGSPGMPGSTPGGTLFISCGASGFGDGYNCGPGNYGLSGADGELGIGSTGTGILNASGWTGTPGSDGKSGAIGNGGSGASSGYDCQSSFGVFGVLWSCTGTGGGGGGGGAGGCGASGGLGGNSGGASMALASVNSVVTLDSCALVAADGGAGGDGGDGATGGAAQLGALGATDPATCDPLTTCKGGDGGRGGHGAPGGGGPGGHSLGVGYIGAAPALNATTVKVGAAGAAGHCGAAPAGYGGAGDPRLCDGKPGRSASTLSSWTIAEADAAPPTGAGVTGVVSNSCRTLDVTWSQATDGPLGTPAANLDYEICWSTIRSDCDGAPTFTAKRTLRNAFTTTISGLVAGTTYYASVRAVDSAGNAGAITTVTSSAVSTTLDFEQPTSPTSLSASGTSDPTALSLTWGAASDDCTAASALVYEVCAGASCVSSGPWTATAPGALTATVTGLPACSVTSVYVRARDAKNKVSTERSTPGRPASTTACFGLDVVPILSNCASSGCHAGKPPTDYTTLMATSAPCGKKLVTAGNPAQSFIYQVTQAAGACPGYPRMSSSTSVADVLNRWITQGAQNN